LHLTELLKAGAENNSPRFYLPTLALDMGWGQFLTIPRLFSLSGKACPVARRASLTGPTPPHSKNGMMKGTGL